MVTFALTRGVSALDLRKEQHKAIAFEGSDYRLRPKSEVKKRIKTLLLQIVKSSGLKLTSILIFQAGFQGFHYIKSQRHKYLIALIHNEQFCSD